MGRFAHHAVGAILLMFTLGMVHAQTAAVLLVHLLPDSGEAQWLLDGDPIGTTAFNETEVYLEIPVTEGTLTARVGGAEALSASIKSRDGWRYVAYLHEGPESAPAVVWSTGHVGEVAGRAQYLRIVNLVPELSDVMANPGESCSHPWELGALPYGTAHSPRRMIHATPGPSTICAGGEKLMTLPAADEDEPENWHVAPDRLKSIVLYQHGGELEATVVDETPEIP